MIPLDTTEVQNKAMALEQVGGGDAALAVLKEASFVRDYQTVRPPFVPRHLLVMNQDVLFQLLEDMQKTIEGQ